jgi:hypothetical protein
VQVDLPYVGRRQPRQRRLHGAHGRTEHPAQHVGRRGPVGRALAEQAVLPALGAGVGEPAEAEPGTIGQAVPPEQSVDGPRLLCLRGHQSPGDAEPLAGTG